MWGARKTRDDLAELRREEAAQHERTRALIKEFAERGEEERRFNREFLRRHEILMGELLDTMAEVRAESRKSQAAAQRAADATEAHTRAVFALIDRLSNGPGSAPGLA